MDRAVSGYEGALTTRAVRSLTPTSCTFELTPSCNLRCHFCYVALDPYKGPYLTTDQVFGILDTLKEAGVLFLTLTGGEIFSRRDFVAIYRYARRSGFLVILFTNATLVNEKIAAVLEAEPPHRVEVSIYGADAEHYEGTTGIPGSFARFERGVALLQGAGVPLLLKHTTSSLTVEHAGKVRSWCEARLLPHKFSMEIENRHDGGQEPSVYRIAPRRLAEFRSELNASVAGGQAKRTGMPLAECAVEVPDGQGTDYLYRCAAGKTSVFIDALGNASHCVLDREPSFSLVELGWKEAWDGITRWVTQPMPLDAPCTGCSLRSGCNNCPARSRLATGSPYLKDPYHCDVTHVANGLEPVRHPDYAARRPLGSCVA